MINYTFIIPHKNSPRLLNRCVNSIPRREDVEIIVVDDDSDPTIVDWNKFRFDDQRGLTLIKDHSRKGAGNARNIGIAKAHGKWLLFADADDYYAKDILSQLDKYKDLDIDVLYFNYNFIDEDGHVLQHPAHDNIAQYCKNQSQETLDYVKYKNYTPWNKMVSSGFINKYNCQFECVPTGNDMFFSFQIAFFANSIKVIDQPLYFYIRYKRSQTNRNWDKEKIYRALIQHIRRNYFYRKVGLERWDYNMFLTLSKDILLHKQRKKSIHALWYLIKNNRQLKKTRDYYFKTVLKNKVNAEYNVVLNEI